MDKEVTDLMGLIELAEKVSSKLEKLKNSQIITIISFAVFFICFVSLTFICSIHYSDIFSNPLLKPLVSLTVIIIGIFIFIYFYLIIKKINRQISTESRVLDKLFNLINPHKSNINKNMSVLKRATIEMRLSRINFNHKESYSFPDIIFSFLRA